LRMATSHLAVYYISHLSAGPTGMANLNRPLPPALPGSFVPSPT